MGRTMLSFLKGLKRMTRASVDAVKAAFKAFKSKIKSLQDMIQSMHVSRSKQGYVKLNDHHVGKVNKIMREGDLGEILKLSKKKVPYTSADVKAYKSMVKHTPDAAYKKLKDVTKQNKKKFPALDVADPKDLSKSGAKDLGKVDGNFWKYFKTTAKVVAMFGAVFVARNWLITGTENRKGCFMLTTINNKVSTCKVQAYTCGGNMVNTCSDNLPYYNITLVLMHLASSPDTDELKIKVAKAAGIEPSEMHGKLAKLIDNNYEAMANVIRDAKTLPKFSICSIKHPDIENGEIPVCRMCSPSADPLSTEYIDTSQYPDNVTFQCSANPSILDTITDIIQSTGKNLFEGLSFGLTTLLKPFAIVGVIILLILIVGSILIKSIKNKS